MNDEQRSDNAITEPTSDAVTNTTRRLRFPTALTVLALILLSGQAGRHHASAWTCPSHRRTSVARAPRARRGESCGRRSSS